MPATVRANVKPELIRWARISNGLDLPQAAKKAQISEDRLAAWEGGIEQPTIKQLRALGSVYKRPLAVFYLPDIPRDFQAQRIKDFRRIVGSSPGAFSPALRVEIRRAWYRRGIAVELFENLQQAPPTFQLKADLGEDPEVVGSRIRAALGLTLNVQRGWATDVRSGFAQMRQATERNGVLVFQASVPLVEMRGVALYEELLPVIILSSQESFIAPRLFTLFHELSHLMLHQSAVSNGAEDGLEREAERAEVFANHVAGAALVPMGALLQEQEITSFSRSRQLPDEIVAQIARRYRVSRETLLRRLLTAGKVTLDAYQAARRRYQEELESRPPRPSGAPRPHVTELSRAGDLFPRLVLQNYYQEKITAPDVADFLNLKLKHLPMVEAELRARRYRPLEE